MKNKFLLLIIMNLFLHINCAGPEGRVDPRLQEQQTKIAESERLRQVKKETEMARLNLEEAQKALEEVQRRREIGERLTSLEEELNRKVLQYQRTQATNATDNIKLLLSEGKIEDAKKEVTESLSNLSKIFLKETETNLSKTIKEKYVNNIEKLYKAISGNKELVRTLFDGIMNLTNITQRNLNINVLKFKLMLLDAVKKIFQGKDMLGFDKSLYISIKETLSDFVKNIPTNWNKFFTGQLKATIKALLTEIIQSPDLVSSFSSSLYNLESENSPNPLSSTTLKEIKSVFSDVVKEIIDEPENAGYLDNNFLNFLDFADFTEDAYLANKVLNRFSDSQLELKIKDSKVYNHINSIIAKTWDKKLMQLFLKYVPFSPEEKQIVNLFFNINVDGVKILEIAKNASVPSYKRFLNTFVRLEQKNNLNIVFEKLMDFIFTYTPSNMRNNLEQYLFQSEKGQDLFLNYMFSLNGNWGDLSSSFLRNIDMFSLVEKNDDFKRKVLKGLDSFENRIIEAKSILNLPSLLEYIEADLLSYEKNDFITRFPNSKGIYDKITKIRNNLKDSIFKTENLWKSEKFSDVIFNELIKDNYLEKSFITNDQIISILTTFFKNQKMQSSINSLVDFLFSLSKKTTESRWHDIIFEFLKILSQEDWKKMKEINPKLLEVYNSLSGWQKLKLSLYGITI